MMNLKERLDQEIRLFPRFKSEAKNQRLDQRLHEIERLFDEARKPFIDQAKIQNELATQLHKAELALQSRAAESVAKIFAGDDESLKFKVVALSLKWVSAKRKGGDR